MNFRATIIKKIDDSKLVDLAQGAKDIRDIVATRRSDDVDSDREYVAVPIFQNSINKKHRFSKIAGVDGAPQAKSSVIETPTRKAYNPSSAEFTAVNKLHGIPTRAPKRGTTYQSLSAGTMFRMAKSAR